MAWLLAIALVLILPWITRGPQPEGGTGRVLVHRVLSYALTGVALWWAFRSNSLYVLGGLAVLWGLARILPKLRP